MEPGLDVARDQKMDHVLKKLSVHEESKTCMSTVSTQGEKWGMLATTCTNKVSPVFRKQNIISKEDFSNISGELGRSDFVLLS